MDMVHWEALVKLCSLAEYTGKKNDVVWEIRLEE